MPNRVRCDRYLPERRAAGSVLLLRRRDLPVPGKLSGGPFVVLQQERGAGLFHGLHQQELQSVARNDRPELSASAQGASRPAIDRGVAGDSGAWPRVLVAADFSASGAPRRGWMGHHDIWQEVER